MSESLRPPSVKRITEIKSQLLRPSLTSHYQCWFNPPSEVRGYLKDKNIYNYNDNDEFISLSCCEASLPGSSLLTNEINDDYTGVTERLAYRRQYDDRADFTFYVDHGRQDGDYNIIWFFESWIAYIANEKYIEAPNYFYRFKFPDGNGGAGQGYRSPSLYITKFERELQGTYLEYRFIKAYPISINSMPVSYDSSELLKCTVSFTYNRYILRRLKNTNKPPKPEGSGQTGNDVRNEPNDSITVYDKGVPRIISRDQNRPTLVQIYEQLEQ